MNKTLVAAVAGAATLFVGGCINAPFRPPCGVVTSIEAPLSTEGNWDVTQKKGTATTTTVLGLVASGDCSVAAAAKNGGIKKVNHVDYRYKNILGLYQETTVIVYGEAASPLHLRRVGE